MAVYELCLQKMVSVAHAVISIMHVFNAVLSKGPKITGMPQEHLQMFRLFSLYYEDESLYDFTLF